MLVCSMLIAILFFEQILCDVVEPDGCPRPDLLQNGHFLPEMKMNVYPVNTYLHFSCDVGFVLKVNTLL